MNEVSAEIASHAQCAGDKHTIVQYTVPFTEAVIRYAKGFTTDGRASRSELWWAMLFAFVLSVGITTLLGGTVFDWVFTITFTILDVCIWWRRMHDLGETGLWSLVPFYNLYLAMKPSMLDENQYGPVPNVKRISIKTPYKIIVTAIFILSLSLAIVGGSDDGKTDPVVSDSITVAQYTQKQIEDLTSEVSSWATQRPDIVKRVENKHGTVTVKKVQVKHYSAQTIDGGGFVREDGENISEHKLILRFWWDGIIHMDGHTDIGFVMDKDGKCIKTWTDETDALIDLEDTDFWFDVGVALGSCL